MIPIILVLDENEADLLLTSLSDNQDKLQRWLDKGGLVDETIHVFKENIIDALNLSEKIRLSKITALNKYIVQLENQMKALEET